MPREWSLPKLWRTLGQLPWRLKTGPTAQRRGYICRPFSSLFPLWHISASLPLVQQLVGEYDLIYPKSRRPPPTRPGLAVFAIASALGGHPQPLPLLAWPRLDRLGPAAWHSQEPWPRRSPVRQLPVGGGLWTTSWVVVPGLCPSTWPNITGSASAASLHAVCGAVLLTLGELSSPPPPFCSPHMDASGTLEERERRRRPGRYIVGRGSPPPISLPASAPALACWASPVVVPGFFPFCYSPRWRRLSSCSAAPWWGLLLPPRRVA